MKNILEWWEGGKEEAQAPEETGTIAPTAEVEVTINKETDNSEEKEEDLGEEDKSLVKGLKAATISQLITFTINQGINKPDGDLDKLKSKLNRYIDTLKSLVEDL
jgi:hypothetical protein